jgi:hypothetical protein
MDRWVEEYLPDLVSLSRAAQSEGSSIRLFCISSYALVFLLLKLRSKQSKTAK